MGALRDSGSQTPISEDLIASHEPDLNLGWCFSCKAHTTAKVVTKTWTNSEHRDVSRTYYVCKHCKRKNWYKPSDIYRGNKWGLGCLLIAVLITIMVFYSNKLFGFEYSTEFGLSSSGVVAIVLLLLGLGFSYQYKWRKWVRSQTQTSFGSSSKPSESQDPQG